ncbi:hypothetical protein Pmani_020737 [Petrolisthes manimaculis]|uniref:Uncharacterized protein n=1 Tax=Petrolisthes manimaculis TaxID=1843537 RepID=A0AAE1PFK6_9EUCA|nr:hypothetical protein Pmani_020737 [Petrolisthes manimaculis]
MRPSQSKSSISKEEFRIQFSPPASLWSFPLMRFNGKTTPEAGKVGPEGRIDTNRQQSFHLSSRNLATLTEMKASHILQESKQDCKTRETAVGDNPENVKEFSSKKTPLKKTTEWMRLHCGRRRKVV